MHKRATTKNITYQKDANLYLSLKHILK